MHRRKGARRALSSSRGCFWELSRLWKVSFDSLPIWSWKHVQGVSASMMSPHTAWTVHLAVIAVFTGPSLAGDYRGRPHDVVPKELWYFNHKPTEVFKRHQLPKQFNWCDVCVSAPVRHILCVLSACLLWIDWPRSIGALLIHGNRSIHDCTIMSHMISLDMSAIPINAQGSNTSLSRLQLPTSDQQSADQDLRSATFSAPVPTLQGNAIPVFTELINSTQS